jgi:hypothetical protein
MAYVVCLFHPQFTAKIASSYGVGCLTSEKAGLPLVIHQSDYPQQLISYI